MNRVLALSGRALILRRRAGRGLSLRGPVLALMPFLALAALAASCSGESEEASPTPDLQVTYYKDVAWLLNDRCVACHRDGGIAPVAFDSYDTARSWAASMRYYVTNRLMPPWPVVGDGSCGNYQDSRWLSDEEISIIGRWMDQGMLEGDPAQGPGPYQPPAGLGSDALELTMDAPYSPEPAPDSTNQDDYRCFLLNPGLDHDQFVTSFEIEPGNAAIVHHVLVYSVDPNQEATTPEGVPVTNDMIIQGLDGEDDRPGWSCFGLAGDGVVPNGLPATWTPGTGLTTYPNGTGVRISAGNYLVMQVHYNMDNATGSDQTTVRFKLSDSVGNEGYVVLYDGMLASLETEEPVVLAPGQSSIDYAWDVTFDTLHQFILDHGGPDVSEVELYGVFPHMHTLGRSMHVALQGGSSDACLADVPLWDFNWQQFYFYKSATRFLKDSVVHITCNYDTTSRTEPTTPGYDTTDEMCLFGAYFTLPPLYTP